jgi:hypothetical protein
MAPHGIPGPKSARPHGGIPSPGAEQRAAERPEGGFWPRIYVVKKGHTRGIYFLLQTRNFWNFSAPFFSLYVLLSTRQCLSSAVLAPLTSSSDPASLSDLRGLFILVQYWALDEVSYMRIVHRVAQGKVFRFCT